jgi:anti-anti-sigma factor
MADNEAQVWKGSQFTLLRDNSQAPATIRFQLSGPLTARDMYGFLSPADFRALLATASGQPEPVTHVFDLVQVPYMDSAGLGFLVSHFAHCERNGIRLIVTGAGPRVLELFRMTKVDKLLQLAEAV